MDVCEGRPYWKVDAVDPLGVSAREVPSSRALAGSRRGRSSSEPNDSLNNQSARMLARGCFILANGLVVVFRPVA